MIEIIGPALVAGIIIALTHAPLGIEVLKRGIIFIDLAIAQIAGLGLIISNLIFNDPSGWITQIIAFSFALVAGLFFRWVEKTMAEQQEAMIGSSFVLSASLALLLLANHPNGGEEIQHLLSGQILFVTWGDISKHIPIYVLILTLWFIKPAIRNSIGFYLLFALAITSSVQLVGVYVVFASLIIPALATVKVQRKYLISWLCGVMSVILGILSSMWLDFPAGPIIIISYFITAIILLALTKIKSLIHASEIP